MPRIDGKPTKKVVAKKVVKQGLVFEVFEQEECPLLSGKLFLNGVVVGEINLLRNSVPKTVPLLKSLGIVIQTVPNSYKGKQKVSK